MIMQCGVEVGVLLITLAALAPSAMADAPDKMGLAGGERALWAYQGSVTDEGGELISFVSRGADDRAKERFYPWAIGPVKGRVVRTCVRGLSLHVFFGDGAHWRFAPGARPWTVLTRPTQSRELSLVPGKFVMPSVLVADDGKDHLYALVTARQAAEVHALAVASANTDESTTEELEVPAVPVAPALPPADRAVVRYEQGVWACDRPAPVDLPVDGEVLAMLAANGVVHLVYQAESNGAPWTYRRSPGSSEPWTEPVELPIKGDPACSAAGWASGEAVLLVGEAGEGGVIVRSLRLADGVWTYGADLVDETGRVIRFSPSPVVALFAGRVAVATVNDEGVAELGLWSLDEGGPMEASSVVKPLTRPAGSDIEPTSVGRIALQCAVLVVGLGAVFMWRRDAVVRAVQLQPDQALASHWRRMAAFAIDSVIIAPVLVAVMSAVLAAGDDGLTPPERLILGMRGSSGIFWALVIPGAVFGLYAGVFETILRATPGKRIVRLSVVREDGTRCELSAIVIRNVVRVVELYFPPLVLLVAVTINRQRLGDLFARTVVVEPAAGSLLGPGRDTPDSPA